MDRPILNPTVFDDPDRHPDPVREPWHFGRRLTGVLRGGATIARRAWRLLWTPLVPRRIQPFIERTPLLARVVSAIVLRLTVVIVLLLATVFSIVHLLTHPLAPPITGAPVGRGVHLDAVTLRASDGVTTEAFLAPALDEEQVLRHGEKAVRAKWPAVVLVPDQRGAGDELDPLIPSLHRRGYVVLLLRLRGSHDRDCPQTFGLLEKLDVQAAIAHLRSLKYVDSSRIAIIGNGTGATASLLARQDDGAIDRVIVHDPVESFDAVLADAVKAPWIRPACRWAFEILHHVDVTDLERDTLLHSLGSDALLLDAPPGHRPQREMIAHYLQSAAPAQAQMSAIR